MVHFSGIYGVGAVCIILFSKYFHKNNFTLFIGGFIIGSVTEYLISFLTETILHTQWWDYTNYILNVNGRICLLYSIFWGLLTVFLVKKVNPKIDKFMNFIRKKISPNILKICILLLIIFLFINCMATCFAQEAFIVRLVKQNGIEVQNQEELNQKYEKIYQNETLAKFIETFWNDEKMIRTFPNIKIDDKYQNVIYLDSLLPEIQPYYYKFFDK